MPIGYFARSSLTALWLLLLVGCASAPLQYEALPAVAGETRALELDDTPFFPQTAYHCGPAALATVLEASGVASVDPDVLADQVYLPAQRGSLQNELLGATRRADRIPYVLDPSLADLLTEVRAGHPVLVLQNLGLPRWPVWHYAVVIGFDLDADEVLLRSGEIEREVLSLKRFERTWQMGDYWAMVVPAPGTLPVTASAQRYLETVVPLEQQQRWSIATAGYRAAARQWPDNNVSFMGLGNIAYQTGDYPEAATQFTAAITITPDAPAPHYNLAWALLGQGNTDGALIAAREAERLSPAHPRFGRAVEALEDAVATGS